MENIRIIKRFTSPLRSILRGGDDENTAVEIVSLLAEYDAKNLLIAEQKFDDGGDPEETHIYRYDERGNLVEHVMEMPMDGIVERFVTTRNAEGLPVIIVKFYGDDPGEKVEYVFGAHGHPVEVLRHDADGAFESKEELEYNDQQLLVKRILTEVNSEPKIFLFAYNDKGLLMKEEELEGKDKPVSRVEYTYNEDGKETSVNKFNGENKLVSLVKSEYDDNGRLARRISKGYYTRISLYEYDEQGRLLEESLSDENGFVISRNRMEYDESGRVSHETVYETDLTRAGRDTHLAHRYEYEFFS